MCGGICIHSRYYLKLQQLKHFMMLKICNTFPLIPITQPLSVVGMNHDLIAHYYDHTFL